MDITNPIKVITIILIMSVVDAQNTDDFKEYGFIDIKTDSLNVPFFVDGYYVGNHPLDKPVPVIPGFHEVSYIPPDIQDEKVLDNLSDGLKRVYVAENDTLQVFLFYDHYLSQIENIQKEFKIQRYIGFTLFGIMIYILLTII